MEATFQGPRYIKDREEEYRKHAFVLYMELVEEADYDLIKEEDFFLTPSESFALCKRVRPQVSTCVKAYYHREYTVDSGASYHTVALQDLTESENKTLRKLDEPLVMDTANGEIIADSEADIYVHNLEMLITALVVPTTTPPLISVGN